MAIDSATKRKSIVAIGQRHVGPVVVPDSTIDAGDRQVVGYSFSGIAADNPAGGVVGLVFRSPIIVAVKRR